jgi:hypothetical protein
MADIQFKIQTDSNEAQKELTKIATTQDKIATSTRKANQELERQEKAFKRTGSAGAKMATAKGGAPQGPNLTPYIPGGGGAEQLKQAMGALGITGVAGAILSLKNAIDANTQATLDRAKEQREISKKIAPNTFYSSGASESERKAFEQRRNVIAQTTATPLEDVDKLHSSFVGIIKNAEDLGNVINNIAIASKLNLGSMEELIALEQKNISSGGIGGGSIADLSKMMQMTGGASQSKDIVDEIAGFKDQAMAFALGTSLIKKDAINAETGMQALQGFQAEGSNTNLRRYMGVGDEVAGKDMLTKFFSFVNERASKKGMTSNEVIDKVVGRGDLDKETGDALKLISDDFSNFNKYLTEFSTNTNNSTDSLKEMISTLENVKKSNVSFSQSFNADQIKVEAEIKNASSGPTVESEAYKAQLELNKKAVLKGMDSRLTKDEGGIVKDNLWNNMLLADKKIPFVTNAASYQKELRSEKSALSDKFAAGTGTAADYLQYGYNTMQQINPLTGGSLANPWTGKSGAEGIEEGLNAGPKWIKDLLSVDASDIPFFGGAVTYGRTGRLTPGKYKTKDEQGNMTEEFTLGGFGQLGLDIGSAGIGSFFGKKAGAKAATKIIGQGDAAKKLILNMAEDLGNKTKEQWLKGDFADDAIGFGEFLKNSFSKTADEKILKLNKTAEGITKTVDDSIEAFTKTPVPFTHIPYLQKGNMTVAETIGATKGGLSVNRGATAINNLYNSTVPPYQSDTESFIKNSYETGSRDVIQVQTVNENKMVEINQSQAQSLNTIIEINKSLLDAMNKTNTVMQTIQQQNVQQKPYNRNKI